MSQVPLGQPLSASMDVSAHMLVHSPPSGLPWGRSTWSQPGSKTRYLGPFLSLSAFGACGAWGTLKEAREQQVVSVACRGGGTSSGAGAQGVCVCVACRGGGTSSGAGAQGVPGCRAGVQGHGGCSRATRSDTGPQHESYGLQSQVKASQATWGGAVHAASCVWPPSWVHQAGVYCPTSKWPGHSICKRCLLICSGFSVKPEPGEKDLCSFAGVFLPRWISLTVSAVGLS